MLPSLLQTAGSGIIQQFVAVLLFFNVHLFGLCMGGLASYVIIVSLFGLFMGGFASYVIIVSDHHNYFYTRKD